MQSRTTRLRFPMRWPARAAPLEVASHQRDCSNSPHRLERRCLSQSSACPGRSEEHTSELQSLMRISYAVFCLKKTNEQTHLRTKQNYWPNPFTSNKDENNNPTHQT